MGIMKAIYTKQKQYLESQSKSQFFRKMNITQFQLLRPSPSVQLNARKLAPQILRPTHLKITIVTETWAPEINGVANSLLNLCLGLQSWGHQIQLIRPKPKQQCMRFKPEKECWVRAQAIPKYPTLQFGWPQISKISNALDDFQPDIVHIVTEGPLGCASLFVAKSKGIPISSGFHSAFQEFSRYFEFPLLVKPIARYLTWFHNRTQITCLPSQDTAVDLKNMGVRGRLQVVGRGVDTQLFSSNKRSHAVRASWGVSEQTRVLLSVGRLSPEKEVGLIIETYKKMLDQGIQNMVLVIVGDGPDRVHLEKLAGAARVIFTGSLVGEALAQVYASADIFIFPSQVETFGNVVLEALASGLPVLAYDYACAKLHVRPEQTGWLIPFGNQSAFILALYGLPDQSVLQRMGQQAEQEVATAGWRQPIQDFESALYIAVEHLHSHKKLKN